MRILAGILILGVLLSVLGAGHLYLAQRLVLDLELSSGAEATLLAGIVALAALAVLEPFAGRLLPRRFARLVAWPGFLWLGAGFLLIVGLGVSDAGRGV